MADRKVILQGCQKSTKYAFLMFAKTYQIDGISHDPWVRAPAKVRKDLVGIPFMVY
ncbi:hypothetical protein ABAC402_06500 [Asticcacaulis sp. AC402]|nr:hypothetical protein ABAC402_06500 [Asticcacaulis sp. AC402]